MITIHSSSPILWRINSHDIIYTLYFTNEFPAPKLEVNNYTLHDEFLRQDCKLKLMTEVLLLLLLLLFYFVHSCKSTIGHVKYQHSTININTTNNPIKT
jgi:hypothetical protein